MFLSEDDWEEGLFSPLAGRLANLGTGTKQYIWLGWISMFHEHTCHVVLSPNDVPKFLNCSYRKDAKV